MAYLDFTETSEWLMSPPRRNPDDMSFDEMNNDEIDDEEDIDEDEEEDEEVDEDDDLDDEDELEEVTDALLLSRSDDFNALAASELRADLGHGHVYRIAPDPREPDLQPPPATADVLGPDAAVQIIVTPR